LVAFRQIQTTTASHPLPQDRHPTTFSVIVGQSNPLKHLFRGTSSIDPSAKGEKSFIQYDRLDDFFGGMPSWDTDYGWRKILHSV
jgi:hypothetical protein